MSIYKNLTMLSTAKFLSGFAGYVYDVGIVIYLYNMTESVAVIGGFFVSQFLPAFVMLMLGEMIDRYNHFYNHERSQLKTGETPLARRLSA